MYNNTIYERKISDGRDLGELGAFPENRRVTVELHIPRRLGATAVSMFFTPDSLASDSGGSVKTDVIPLKWIRLELADDVYSVVIDTSLPRGLYFYRYSVSCIDGELWYPDADRQLLVYGENFTTPEPVEGIIYHIFVDRFKSGGGCPVKKVAVLDPDWDGGIPQYGEKPGDPVPNNVFFGGDLYGVAEKLDYIASLGTRYIYLSPVFDAASNHKYDVGNYLKVDEMFGSDEALAELIVKARRYGIGIILDGVFNHTGADSVYFNQMNNYSSIGAARSKKSPYRKWYTFHDDGTYDCWWNVKTLPRVNCDEPSYRRFIFGEVVPKWMKMGVEGWRLDVADELSDSFLEGFRKTVKNCSPNALIVGEVWENASNKVSYGKRRGYLYGDSLDSVMNYPLRDAVIAYIRDGDAKKMTAAVDEIYRDYPPAAQNVLMNLLGSHDTERIITALVGDPCGKLTNAQLSVKRMTKKQMKLGRTLMKLAYALICAMPGIPCLFYGDECALEGYRDPFCRMPFPWSRADEPETAAFTNEIRFLGSLRKTETQLSRGKLTLLHCDESMCAVLRQDENGALIIAVNRAHTHTPIRKISADCEFFNLRSKRKASYITVKPYDYSVYRVLTDNASADMPEFEII